jgi:transcriptional regulator with XRE-family HTH domain
MTDATKEEILSLNIGTKIKLLRKDKQFTLQDLSKRSGLSKPLLSQVENGLVIPPLTTLLRISKALRVSMSHFISEEEARLTLVRKNEIKSAPRRKIEGRDPRIYKYCSLVEGKTKKRMEPLYVEFSPAARAKVSTLSHHGDEFIHILEGKLEVIYDDNTIVLQAGDNLYLDGRIPHAYRSLTKKRTRAIMIVAE